MTNPATNDPPISAILGEVLHGAQELITQHFDLLRSDIRNDVEHLKGAAVGLTAGATLLAAGGLFSTLMLVHVLQKVTRLPLWACHGLLGGSLGAAGIRILSTSGQQVRGLPLRHTAAAVKENVEWLKSKAGVE